MHASPTAGLGDARMARRTGDARMRAGQRKGSVAIVDEACGAKPLRRVVAAFACAGTRRELAGVWIGVAGSAHSARGAIEWQRRDTSARLTQRQA